MLVYKRDHRALSSEYGQFLRDLLLQRPAFIAYVEKENRKSGKLTVVVGITTWERQLETFYVRGVAGINLS